MATELREFLAPFLLRQTPPGGAPYLSVSAGGVAALAAARGVGLRAAMMACLAEGLWPERLRGNRGAFSTSDQMALLAARVAVLGAGGLGGGVILLLARLGVGSLVVVDPDRFAEGNLNRQPLSDLAGLGEAKAAVAARAVAGINPAVEVIAREVKAGPENLPGLLAGAALAVDCLDNLESRFALEAAAGAAGLPYVHGALAGLEGFVMTVFPGEPGLRGLYGCPPAAGLGAARVMGVPTPTPALVAGFQVLEVAGVLTGRRRLKAGEVLHLDFARPEMEILRLA